MPALSADDPSETGPSGGGGLRSDLAFDDFRAALRPGMGLGVRVLRAVSLEATADDVIALGQQLDRAPRATFHHAGGGQGSP